MSQNSRILEVLGDGRKHTMREIHERAGFMRLNSRVSELRSHGYRIDCWREGRDYIYRLSGTLAEVSAAKTDGESVSRVEPPLPGLALTSASVPSDVPQPGDDDHISEFDGTLADGLDEAGTLELFACEIDESAGLRGAYGDAA